MITWISENKLNDVSPESQYYQALYRYLAKTADTSLSGPDEVVLALFSSRRLHNVTIQNLGYNKFIIYNVLVLKINFKKIKIIILIYF